MDRIIDNLLKTLEFEKRYFRKYIPSKVEVYDYDRIKNEILKCNKCELHKTIHNKVIGYGNIASDLMLIGEAPGYNEDKSGKPFVGKAGKKLTQMLEYIGVKREDIYISNVLKCRPPNNADPMPHWIEQCSSFLEMEIELVNPKYILALGRFAARFLIKKELRMKDMSGNIYKYKKNILVFPTYHPSSLLMQKGERLNTLRRKVAADLMNLKKIMEEGYNG